MAHPPKISQVPQNGTGAIAIRQQSSLEIRSSPLPSPDELKAYNVILPGAAERILAMAEKQANHRQETESVLVQAGTKQNGRGQNFAFILCICCLVASVILGCLGQTIPASITGGIAILYVGRTFLGKSSQKKK